MKIPRFPESLKSRQDRARAARRGFLNLTRPRPLVAPKRTALGDGPAPICPISPIRPTTPNPQ